MVKLIFFCSRKVEISHERYAELLLDGHVPIALRHHPTLRKYVVNIVEASPPHQALDSIGELYFDTLADFRERLYDSPEGQRIVEADVAGFMGRVTAYLVEEQVVRPEPRPSVMGRRSPLLKVMTCLRHPDIDVQGFLAHWRDHHTALVLGRTQPIIGYVRDTVVDRLSPQGPPWHGIETCYLEPGSGATVPPELPAAGAADRDRFVSDAASYRLAEYVQKLP